MTGIYKWTSPSGKYYIGQAVNLKRRRADFLRFNSTYTSEGSAIDNARRKYNKSEDWTYEILATCTKDQLDELEIFYISLYDSANSRKGYNSNKGGGGNKGYKPTAETILKIKNNRPNIKGENNPMYGKHHTDETKKRISELNSGKKYPNKSGKKVYQYTLDNKFVAEYDSQLKAAEAVGCDKSMISLVCRGIKKTAKGFHWYFEKL